MRLSILNNNSILLYFKRIVSVLKFSRKCEKVDKSSITDLHIMTKGHQEKLAAKYTYITTFIHDKSEPKILLLVRFKYVLPSIAFAGSFCCVLGVLTPLTTKCVNYCVQIIISVILI